MVQDIVPGIVVGLLGVPEGIAFALLAGLGPEHGIYTSIFPVIFYIFLGTSRHAAIGTYTMTTLLVAFCVKTWVPYDDPHHSSLEEVEGNSSHPVFNRLTIPEDGLIIDHEIIAQRAAYASSLALCSGCMMVVFSILNLGFLFSYFSDPLIAGLTLGGALQVFFTQIPELTGMHIEEHFGPLNIFLNVWSTIQEYSHAKHEEVITSLMTISLAVISLMFLAGFDFLEKYLEHAYESHHEKHEREIQERKNERRQLNSYMASTGRNDNDVEFEANSEIEEFTNKPWRLLTLEKITSFPFPSEFLVVLIMTGIVYFADLKSIYHVDCVEEYPRGYPDIPAKMAIPKNYEYQFFGMAFLIVIVGYFSSVSLMKVIAEDKDYKVVPNQELFALGITNILSSIFGSFPAFLREFSEICDFFHLKIGRVRAALTNLIQVFVPFNFRKYPQTWLEPAYFSKLVPFHQSQPEFQSVSCFFSKKFLDPFFPTHQPVV